MKYEIRNMGSTTGVILNLIQNLINYWIPNQVWDYKFSQTPLYCHSRLDRELSIIKLVTKVER